MAPVIYCLSLFFLSYPLLSFSASGLSSLVSPCMYDRGFFFSSRLFSSLSLFSRMCVFRFPQGVRKTKSTRESKRKVNAVALPNHYHDTSANSRSGRLSGSSLRCSARSSTCSRVIGGQVRALKNKSDFVELAISPILLVCLWGEVYRRGTRF